MRAEIHLFQGSITSCGKIAGNTTHPKAIRAVWGNCNLDDRVIQPRIGGKGGTNRRITWQIDDPVMLVRELHLAL